MVRPVLPDPRLRLAAIVESSDDAIVSKDLTGIITSWNRGAEQMFGYTADEAVGQSITMLIPSDRRSEEDHVLGRIRQGQRVEHFETVRHRKDGTPIDVSLTVSPIRDDGGTIVGASKIARDITARKRTEAELAQLQHRLMSLANASGSILGSREVEAVWSATIALARDLFNADGYALWRCVEATWRVVASSGVSEGFAARVIATAANAPVPNEVVFSEPLIFEDVSTAPIVAELRDAYQAERIQSMVVFPLAVRGRSSGTMVFYFRRRHTFPDMDVQVGRALANLAAAAVTTVEIYDEQRTGREAAEHARQQAAFLAEAGTVLSASLDYEHTLRAVASLAVPTIADWCAVDVRGDRGAVQRLAVTHADPAKVSYARALEKRYPPNPAASGGVYEVMRTGKALLMSRIPAALLDTAAHDEEHRRILAELGLTSFMCVPMLAHGTVFGAITFVSAESGREYTDNDLRLAREIAARASLSVENARLYAQANDANRLKDEFLATLSHELRTPLNAVLGYARMVRMGAVPADKTKSALEVVERNATALKQIIEDVLDVSRIVSGRLRLNVEPVDLPTILQEACATVLPAADAKGVRVETVIEPITTPVSGDPARLQQIVWNVLSNAIKFTTRGGKVQLRLARVNSHVEVTVSDTGKGITPDFLPFVFDRFRQGDSTLSREQGGLGLGLSIAKQLAELHGGSIEAASGGADRGATFTIKLPLMVAYGDVAPTDVRVHPRTDRLAPAVSSAPRLDGVHVLAVDDELDSLHLLQSVLEDAGAAVTIASSGAMALEALAQHLPDVMVADIGMPEMDGLQLIRAIRGNDGPMRHLPAAALTAYARSQDRVTALASGFHMHLAKPIDPIELLVAVAALVSRGGRA